MQPAEGIIKRCGGATRVAEITGRDVSTVHRWMYPKERGGTDGVIPAKMQMLLMEAASRGEINLEPADFFAGTSPDAERTAAE